MDHLWGDTPCHSVGQCLFCGMREAIEEMYVWEEDDQTGDVDWCCAECWDI